MSHPSVTTASTLKNREWAAGTSFDVRQEMAQRSISTKDQDIRAGQWQDKETTNT
jgi:hypothetical protein